MNKFKTLLVMLALVVLSGCTVTVKQISDQNLTNAGNGIVTKQCELHALDAVRALPPINVKYYLKRKDRDGLAKAMAIRLKKIREFHEIIAKEASSCYEVEKEL